MKLPLLLMGLLACSQLEAFIAYLICAPFGVQFRWVIMSLVGLWKCCALSIFRERMKRCPCVNVQSWRCYFYQNNIFASASP